MVTVLQTPGFEARALLAGLVPPLRLSGLALGLSPIVALFALSLGRSPLPLAIASFVSPVVG